MGKKTKKESLSAGPPLPSTRRRYHHNNDYPPSHHLPSHEVRRELSRDSSGAVIVIRFTQQASGRVKALILDRWLQEGLQIRWYSSSSADDDDDQQESANTTTTTTTPPPKKGEKEDGRHYPACLLHLQEVALTATCAALCRKAEQIRLVKPSIVLMTTTRAAKATTTMEFFTVAQRERFVRPPVSRSSWRPTPEAGGPPAPPQQKNNKEIMTTSKKTQKPEQDHTNHNQQAHPHSDADRRHVHLPHRNDEKDEKDEENEEEDPSLYFTPSEQGLLLGKILDDLHILRPGEVLSDLSDCLDEEYRIDGLLNNHQLPDQLIHSSPPLHGDTTTSLWLSLFRWVSGLFQPQPEQQNRQGQANTRRQSFTGVVPTQLYGEQSAYLNHVLQTYRLIEAMTLLHDPATRQQLLHDTWWPWYRLLPPVQALQQYYGGEIAFYFGWMGFLTQWLLFPGLFGLFVVAVRGDHVPSIDDSKMAPFYAMVVFVWAVLFLRFWERQENRYAHQWGTLTLSPYERLKFFSTRPQFRGQWRISPVTGQPETFYPSWIRRMQYVVSALVTLVMLAVAFAVMICSLNLQGYIRPQNNPLRWTGDRVHPFHIPALAQWAEPGQALDANTWRGMIPVVIHVTAIFTLNNLYRMVAQALTDWENHETAQEHAHSLMLKRFLFEAFDCYVALFYLAFYERDVDKLSQELAAVFQLDTLRRVLLECIVPMLWQRVSSRLHRRHPPLHTPPDGKYRPRPTRPGSHVVSEKVTSSSSDEGEKKFADSSAGGGVSKMLEASSSAPLEEWEKDLYDEFDDYMEIVIQFGYVTLFASAYPLAALVSVAANWVEIRADAFKIATVCQRPMPSRSSGLGMWRTLMYCIVWMSALTNSLIVGYTSDQLMQFFPHLYVQYASNPIYTEMDHDKSWIVVFLIFAMEHALLVVALLLFVLIPAVPEDVRDELERSHFLHLERERSRSADMNGTERLQQLTKKKTQ